MSSHASERILQELGPLPGSNHQRTRFDPRAGVGVQFARGPEHDCKLTRSPYREPHIPEDDKVSESAKREPRTLRTYRDLTNSFAVLEHGTIWES